MPQEDEPTRPKYIVPAAGKRGMTELHYAAYCNDPDAVREQLELGIPVDIKDDGDWTPLLWSIDMAQAWGQPRKVVSILLAAGASPNAVNNESYSVLMMACGRNNDDILDQLIRAGADVRARNAMTTPMHVAAGCNFASGIRRLLLLGVDPTQTDADGDTPEQVAEICGFPESVAVFRAFRLSK